MANRKGAAERVAENVEKFHNPQEPGIFKDLRSDLVTVAVRIDPAFRARLEVHFRERGLKLGQGLRLALNEWASKEGIR
jgi:hypothetical protein